MSIAASRFRAMNTDIALLVPSGGPDFERAASIVQRVFSEVENSLSRFLPRSDLSRLNRSSGSSAHVPPLLFMAVSLALRAAEETDGVFDPTILPALEHAGYDRSFEYVAAGGRSTPSSTPLSPHPNFRTVRCDPRNQSVTLAPGQRIDLGGIGKGLAVDLAMGEIPFLADCCISAGGDIAVRGSADTRGGWTVALEDPGRGDPRPLLLRDAAMATSTTSKRRWQVDGQERHHLIDPATSRPTSSPLRSVSVVAGNCVQADVAAKTALLLGERGIAFLEHRGLHGLAVRHDGSTVSTAAWPSAEHG